MELFNPFNIHDRRSTRYLLFTLALSLGVCYMVKSLPKSPLNVAAQHKSILHSSNQRTGIVIIPSPKEE